ncbi:uncharacterized protein LOC119166708 [Rhipicephalus microplus]|uniref:uncharacterized protein LOC119166708 n=1 Tax=Rhipicephalus microplus TaxID=6941 RepID=UPI003F6AB239
MASTSRVTASRKRRIFGDSRASGREYSHDNSTGSEDDIDTFVFSTDDESSSNCPGTSVVVHRKSTFFERDHLPAVAQSVQFLARRQPEMNHRTALRSAARRFKPTYSGKDSSWRCHSSS